MKKIQSDVLIRKYKCSKNLGGTAQPLRFYTISVSLYNGDTEDDLKWDCIQK